MVSRQRSSSCILYSVVTRLTEPHSKSSTSPASQQAMVLWTSPLLPLHKTQIREIGGIYNYLESCTCHRVGRNRKEQQVVWAIGSSSKKISVKIFALELRSARTTQFLAPSRDLKRSLDFGAGPKVSNTDPTGRTPSLDRTMSPQTGVYNGRIRNLDANSEVGNSSSPSNFLNFANLELPSGEESKQVSSQAPAEAEFSGDKRSPPTYANGKITVSKAGIGGPSSRTIAVIGAGAAGLVAARELIREGHDVVIYEQGEEVGGVWQYDPRIEDDPLGIDPNRSRVHSSMYHSLRTNLPREVMGYLDYPFVPKEGEGRDGRRFPSHGEVVKYLKDFCEDYSLTDKVKFGVKVDYVGLQNVLKGPNVTNQWVVKFHKSCECKTEEHQPETEVFDAVVVCNGHYAEPRLSHIRGLESWPGEQIHSHNYRFPHPFQDKVVLVIGNGNSAQDITSEIATLAKEVHQCARAWTSIEPSNEGKGPQHNIWQHPMVTRAYSDGTVEFHDGTSATAEIILYCTGYLFSFPFLDTKGYISVEDNRVGPLYKHVFPPALAPELSFVGLPWKVIPFPLMELQSRWIARLLSGKSSLPTESEMTSDIKTLYEQLNASSFPKSYTHNCGPYQFEYVDWLAEQSGHEPVEDWRKEIYRSCTQNKVTNPATYRDEVEDQHWFEVAMASLEKISVPSKGLSKASVNET